MLSLEDINNIVEKNYNKKFDKTTSFIDDSIISNVLIKDKSSKVPSKAIRYILGEYLDIKESYRIRNADLVGYSLDNESFTQALDNIYNIWNEDNKTKGILYPYCIFANNIQLDNLYKMAVSIASGRFKLACFMFEAIALSASKKGLGLVYEASRKFKQRSIRNTCSGILTDITIRLGMSKEAFADKIIPDFDFNRDGIRIIESDNKKFKITLKPDFSISIFDEIKNKEYKTIPKDFPQNPKKELTKLKSEINKMLKTQTERLLLVLMDGRKWTLNEWKEIFFDNPFMRAFAVKLIWGVYDKDNNLLSTFRYMEDGSFNNADDEEMNIEDNALITLLSPMEVNKELIEKWKNQLLDYDIVQPFNQLSLDTIEELISKIPRTVTVGAIKNTALKLGMEKEDGDGGFINSYFLYDSYNEASLYIEVSDIYYSSANNDTTDIEIKFENSDERFEYGAYLILSNYLK
ncbi:hypothetical protein A966_04731 [Brachyspira hampsonii 30446]|uniref:DUF4132 domain-containing protein n=1 Tax=Brachyspira hampsonii 30446 TaxID=1289135 RepID=A0A2U4FQQ6_9SPIR|nr:DUF4132 domain-containing protein [Brachyspira hampsonii]EKV57553.1 hypothetical protein A966_04731 [Brachyspira hampsonii 30446]OEJ17348.1 molybdate metabolism regulator [Brachyspira hampsonii]